MAPKTPHDMGPNLLPDIVSAHLPYVFPIQPKWPPYCSSNILGKSLPRAFEEN